MALSASTVQVDGKQGITVTAVKDIVSTCKENLQQYNFVRGRLTTCSKISGKRVNFIAIQQSHSIACEGYHAPTVCTGYEDIIAQRSGEMFAITAKQPGTVVDVTPSGVIVKYEDGQRQGYKTGEIHGRAAGLIVPHRIATLLKKGQKFNVGDAIIYHTGFFEPDYFKPGKVIFKNYLLVDTVLWESHQTLEDSSSISSKIAGKILTDVTKEKIITVSFQDAVVKLVKPGDAVEYDTPLCYIQDSVTAGAGIFDEKTIDSLKILSSQVPKAGVKGTVSKVEVFYHGDIEDMSPQLAALARASDREFKRVSSELEKTNFTGQVDGGFRVDGTPLELDNVAIRVYINYKAPAGVGDKGVFSNQLKTVVGEVFEEPYRTEQGMEIHAIFGAKSIDKRIVSSAHLIGTTNSVLELIANEMVKTYES